MANLPHVQYQAAAPFDGTAGKGLFTFLGDVTITTISIVCTGGVSKNVSVSTIRPDGTLTGLIYEKLATTIDKFSLIGAIPIVDGDQLKITVSAGAPIRVQVVEKSLKG